MRQVVCFVWPSYCPCFLRAEGTVYRSLTRDSLVTVGAVSCPQSTLVSVVPPPSYHKRELMRLMEVSELIGGVCCGVCWRLRCVGSDVASLHWMIACLLVHPGLCDATAAASALAPVEQV